MTKSGNGYAPESQVKRQLASEMMGLLLKALKDGGKKEDLQTIKDVWHGAYQSLPDYKKGKQ